MVHLFSTQIPRTYSDLDGYGRAKTAFGFARMGVQASYCLGSWAILPQSLQNMLGEVFVIGQSGHFALAAG